MLKCSRSPTKCLRTWLLATGISITSLLWRRKKRPPVEPPPSSSGGIAPWLFLLVIAAGLSLSGCSFPAVTVRHSLPPPTVCLLKCPLPPSPPETTAENSRRQWEFDMIDAAGACYALHEQCGAGIEQQQKMKEAP